MRFPLGGEENQLMRGFKLALGLVLGLIIACSIGGCKAQVEVARAGVERDAAPQATNLSTLVTDNTEFAFELYHQLAGKSEGNLIFSPYSISLAFAMVYAGARGDTAAQMAETLHYTLPQEQLHPAFNALDLTLQPPVVEQATPDTFRYSNADDLTLSIANAVWGQKGFPFEKSYLETLGLNYGAGLNLADFSANPDVARQTISQWVEEKTGGHIKNMPPPGAISSQTKLAIVNAIYFKAEWTFPFAVKNTHDGAFHLVEGGEVSVPLMVNDDAHFECGRGDNYYAIEITYGASEKTAMLILLPDTGSFQDFENGLDAGFFQDVLAGLQFTNGLTLTIPRFKFESDFNLRQSLSAMGMTAPFESADLTGISSEKVSIDYAEHKATISVDEQGTEASGMTSISMPETLMMTDCGSQVVADRPFIFAIYDVKTGAILFLGRVMNPAA